MVSSMRIAIIGGDFRSIVLSYLLAESGHDVHLITKDTSIGGFARGFIYKDLNLDLGPQYLDNFTSSDRALIEKICQFPLVDLGFSYSNLIGGVLSSEQMALPSWHNFFTNIDQLAILAEIIDSLQSDPTSENDSNSLYSFISRRFGPRLSTHIDSLSHKFYGVSLRSLDLLSQPVIPFACNRQAIFDGETSSLLKSTSSFLDSRLAAPKSHHDNTYFNLYPPGGFCKFFDAISASLISLGVELFTDSSVHSISKNKNSFSLSLTSSSNNSIEGIDKLIFGLDERLAEQIIFNTNELESLTYYVPQYFTYVKSSASLMGDLNYVFDYDISRLPTRYTNISKYVSSKTLTICIVSNYCFYRTLQQLIGFHSLPIYARLCNFC